MSTDVTRGPGALEALTPMLDALPEEELLELNVDVFTVAARVLGALPNIRTLEAGFATRAPEFDLTGKLERLEQCAYCLLYTHSKYLSTSRDRGCPPELISEAQDLRGQLASAARMLARCRLIDPTRLSNLSRYRGYVNLSTDLTMLAVLFMKSWTDFEGKHPITRQQLHRAAWLGEHLIEVTAHRKRKPEELTLHNTLRRRAYTLLYRAYDEIRGVVHNVRWSEKDADRFAPSLFRGRGGRGSAKPPTQHRAVGATCQAPTVHQQPAPDPQNLPR